MSAVNPNTDKPTAQAVPGCACGGGIHDPASHLWTLGEIARATRRSVWGVRDDRYDPSCPLHKRGGGRGSRKLVFSWEEVQDYMAWSCRRDAGGAR